jgi:hypothetical protein
MKVGTSCVSKKTSFLFFTVTINFKYLYNPKNKKFPMIKSLFSNFVYLIFLLFCLIAYAGVSYAVNNSWRPWAYSSDKNAKLFVGKWAGQFQDPDGVSKKITLEVFPPLTTFERFDSFTACSKKGKNKSRKSFEGSIIVTSVLGEENYEMWGYFKDTDFQNFYFHERIKQTLTAANFYLKQTESNCTWKGDDMTIILPFEYQKKDGTGFWSSDDARFSQKATVVMKRQ